MINSYFFLNTSLILYFKSASFLLMRSKRGEIITAITIGAFIVITTTAIISSFFADKPQTTSTRAQANTDCSDRPQIAAPGPGYYWEADCNNNKQDMDTINNGVGYLLPGTPNGASNSCANAAGISENSFCKQNTIQGEVGAGNSNQCYGFTGPLTPGYKNFRCIVLKYQSPSQATPTPTQSQQQSTPTPGQIPANCNDAVQQVYFDRSQRTCYVQTNGDTNQIGCYVRQPGTTVGQGCQYLSTRTINGRTMILFNCQNRDPFPFNNNLQVAGLKYAACSINGIESTIDWSKAKFWSPIATAPESPEVTPVPNPGGATATPPVSNATATPRPTEPTRPQATFSCGGKIPGNYWSSTFNMCFYCSTPYGNGTVVQNKTTRAQCEGTTTIPASCSSLPVGCNELPIGSGKYYYCLNSNDTPHGPESQLICFNNYRNARGGGPTNTSTPIGTPTPTSPPAPLSNSPTADEMVRTLGTISGRVVIQANTSIANALLQTANPEAVLRIQLQSINAGGSNSTTPTRSNVTRNGFSFTFPNVQRYIGAGNTARAIRYRVIVTYQQNPNEAAYEIKRYENIVFDETQVIYQTDYSQSRPDNPVLINFDQHIRHVILAFTVDSAVREPLRIINTKGYYDENGAPHGANESLPLRQNAYRTYSFIANNPATLNTSYREWIVNGSCNIQGYGLDPRAATIRVPLSDPSTQTHYYGVECSTPNRFIYTP